MLLSAHPSSWRATTASLRSRSSVISWWVGSTSRACGDRGFCSTALTVLPSGLRPKRAPQTLAISSSLSGGCSALRSTIFLRIVGGSTSPLGLGETRRGFPCPRRGRRRSGGRGSVPGFPSRPTAGHGLAEEYERPDPLVLLCSGQTQSSSSCSQSSVGPTRRLFLLAMPPPQESQTWDAKDAMGGGLRPVLQFRAFHRGRAVLPSLAPRGRCAVFGEVSAPRAMGLSVASSPLLLAPNLYEVRLQPIVVGVPIDTIVRSGSRPSSKVRADTRQVNQSKVRLLAPLHRLVRGRLASQTPEYLAACRRGQRWIRLTCRVGCYGMMAGQKGGKVGRWVCSSRT